MADAYLVSPSNHHHRRRRLILTDNHPFILRSITLLLLVIVSIVVSLPLRLPRKSFLLFNKNRIQGRLQVGDELSVFGDDYWVEL